MFHQIAFVYLNLWYKVRNKKAFSIINCVDPPIEKMEGKIGRVFTIVKAKSKNIWPYCK